MKVLLIFSSCFLFSFSILAQQRKLALVIGNADYQNSEMLTNTVNDANIMGSTLENLDFDVIKVTNADKKSMGKAILDFRKKMVDYDVALFYYAGHGMQIDGANYLIPTDAKIKEESDIQYEGINVNKVVNQFHAYPNNINIVILDACRDNPFRSWNRGEKKGFRAIKAPSGTIIAYATAEGATASDGNGQYGLYTQKLVEQIKKPQRLVDVFLNTRIEVQKASNHNQIPQEWSQLTGKFYFKRPTIENQAMKSEIILGKSENIATYGNVIFTSEISGSLYLDNKKLGFIKANTKVPIKNLSIGSHQIEIKGITHWKENIEVKKGQNTLLTAKKNEGTFLNEIIETVYVEGGSFYMGCNGSINIDCKDNEMPQHKSQISSFRMGKYEVTQAQWNKIMDNNPSKFKDCDDCPVENVSWNDIQFFIKKLNNKTGLEYRLPTEAEWEYAARGGSINSNDRNYSYIEDNGWFADNSRGKTRVVGQKQANELGIYDMMGNVWEWCQDWKTKYTSAENINPSGPSKGKRKVLRGGSWSRPEKFSRVTNRIFYNPESSYSSIGFRLCRECYNNN